MQGGRRAPFEILIVRRASGDRPRSLMLAEVVLKGGIMALGAFWSGF